MNKLTLIAALAAATLALSAYGCSASEATGRASLVGKTPRGSEIELPEYVTYAAGADLVGVTNVGLSTNFPDNPDWLMVQSGSDATIEMTDLGCSLLMQRGSSADLGGAFTGEDATDTVATLVTHLGTTAESTLPILWRGNEGAISVDALVFVVVTEAGEKVLGVARAFGSLDSFVYAELSCIAGVSTETVFAQQVAPYISVDLS